ncbi:hypothetical protein C5O80_37835 [Burkholderia sp. SRS-46]|nr:hypothetical protein C5O80_37835 [Burkholderia sp. SRS-46]
MRQGLKPEGGETRAARLDAQRESPARSEAKGGAQGRPQIPHERVERGAQQPKACGYAKQGGLTSGKRPSRGLKAA